jgi:hypothetical protein
VQPHSNIQCWHQCPAPSATPHCRPPAGKWMQRSKSARPAGKLRRGAGSAAGNATGSAAGSAADTFAASSAVQLSSRHSRPSFACLCSPSRRRIYIST